MFFETPRTISATPAVDSSKFGLVRVTQGTLTEEQVCQQLRRLVSESFHWSLVRLEDQIYRVEFPRREDLHHLLKCGLSKVPGSKCILEFDECKKPEPMGIPLEKVWVRLSGVPETLLNDYLIVASLGSLLVKQRRWTCHSHAYMERRGYLLVL